MSAQYNCLGESVLASIHKHMLRKSYKACNETIENLVIFREKINDVSSELQI